MFFPLEGFVSCVCLGPKDMKQGFGRDEAILGYRSLMSLDLLKFLFIVVFALAG